MPHTVESTISLSERDLARGAIDLAPEPEYSMVNTTLAPLFNNTVLEAAVSVIKDAGPKLIDTIVHRLVPVSQYQGSELSTVSPTVSMSNQLPTVYMAPPVETIIIVPPSNHSANPPGILNTDTVRLRISFFLCIISKWLLFYLIVASIR
jgi:hypothetical protein